MKRNITPKMLEITEYIYARLCARWEPIIFIFNVIPVFGYFEYIFCKCIMVWTASSTQIHMLKSWHTISEHDCLLIGHLKNTQRKISSLHESAVRMSGMLARKRNEEAHIHALGERIKFLLKGDMPLSLLLRVNPVGGVTQKAKKHPSGSSVHLKLC